MEISSAVIEQHLLWPLILILILFVGGCGDGAVVANGRVYIDGKPAPMGRLILNPVGKGDRAYSLVSNEGSFGLRSSNGEAGAWPGKYLVVFQHPVDAKSSSPVANVVPGEIESSELTVVYQSEAGNPFVIPAADSDDLKIDIQQKLGWKRLLSE